MPFEYKPGNRDRPFNQWRCKASVYDRTTRRSHQCSRRPKIDGWCKQHHPDVEAARREKAYKQKWENTPLVRCQRELATVTAQRDALLAALGAVEWVLVKHWGGYTKECPWCHADWANSGGQPPPHRDDCERQAAIALATTERD